MRTRHAVGHGIQRVIGQARAVRVEEIQTGFQRLHHAFQIQAVDAGDAGQAVHVIHKAAALDVEHLVRPPRRIDLEIAGGVLLDQGVMLQIVHRVVGGADDLHAEFLDQAAAAVFLRRQQRVRAVPNVLGGLFAQDILDAEHAAQLQMRPVEHRVADAVFEARGKGQPLVMPACVAADELLVHAVGEHHAPLVVVAAEHQLADVFELMVFIDHARGDVAMIVINRHVFRVLVIQLFGHIIFKQKILIHKRFHGVLLLCFWLLPFSTEAGENGRKYRGLQQGKGSLFEGAVTAAP